MFGLHCYFVSTHSCKYPSFYWLEPASKWGLCNFFARLKHYIERCVSSCCQERSHRASAGGKSLPNAHRYFFTLIFKMAKLANETSWENVDALFPHSAALSKLLIAKANIPRSWKGAKFAPIHKKWPFIQSDNYRMIAISGILHRLVRQPTSLSLQV